jgi:hypothetical protein
MNTMIGSARPMRDANEDDYSFEVRTGEHQDVERFETAVGKRLVGWNIHRHVRFHLESGIEPDTTEPGVWVPLQIYVSFHDAGVDPEGWEE